MRFIERLGAIAVFPLAASFAIAIWGMPAALRHVPGRRGMEVTGS